MEQNRDYTSDFKVGVDNSQVSTPSVAPESAKVDSEKQKIINDVKSIKDKTFVDNIMKANRTLIAGVVVGAGVGFVLAFKFNKGIIAGSLIGAGIGLGVTKLYSTLNK